MLIAQITDTHFVLDRLIARGTVDPVAALTACVARLNALSPQPDVVLGTGDLTDDGTRRDVFALKEVLADLKSPFLPIPGNHDDRALMAEAFGLSDRDGFLHYVIEEFPLRLIALDTVVPGATGGRMCGERLAWLAARLAERPQAPTVLFMHHPPFPTGIAYMDGWAFEGGPALADLVGGHPQVVRILCGHLHRPVHVCFGGTVAAVAPSAAFQLELSLDAAARPAVGSEPAAIALHLWDGNDTLIGHQMAIGGRGP